MSYPHLVGLEIFPGMAIAGGATLEDLDLNGSSAGAEVGTTKLDHPQCHSSGNSELFPVRDYWTSNKFIDVDKLQCQCCNSIYYQWKQFPLQVWDIFLWYFCRNSWNDFKKSTLQLHHFKLFWLDDDSETTKSPPKRPPRDCQKMGRLPKRSCFGGLFGAGWAIH